MVLSLFIFFPLCVNDKYFINVIIMNAHLLQWTIYHLLELVLIECYCVNEEYILTLTQSIERLTMIGRLTPQEAAKYLTEQCKVKTTNGTLAAWRSLGRGPRYIKVGRRCLYEKKALDEFAQGQVVETIDSGKAA